LFPDTAILPAIEEDAAAEYGEVFTKRWVVELILDLCGYTADRELHNLVAVEPACGTGAFVVPMVERLVASTRAAGVDLRLARLAIVARDLRKGHVDTTRVKVNAVLTRAGLALDDADALSRAWIRQDDFLLGDLPERSADVVAGNPPYIRLESIPRERSAAYRRACPTMGGRADIYVGFYEKALNLLRDDGRLGFICADRWMRNAYGAGLREFIGTSYAVETVMTMTGVDAFEESVDAYPAITVMRRGSQLAGPVLVDAEAEFGEEQAREVLAFTKVARPHDHRRSKFYSAAQLATWFNGRAGWPSGSPDQLEVLADLEGRLPTLEDAATATKVGIGVATGADRVFLVEDIETAEPERMLRIALPRDLSEGHVAWSGTYLVNPWGDEGLVDLEYWPRLSNYLHEHRAILGRRHVAKTGPWYKTIDRVLDGLAACPKLYLPDFAERMAPVLDEGGTYPHHNLYWVVSEEWDLRVLGGILMSDVANLFVNAYSVRMRGGYLRFQAQYLRRVRLPRPSDIDEDTKEALIDSFDRRDHALATELSLPLYGLDRLP
jgi:hypothetical protein